TMNILITLSSQTGDNEVVFEAQARVVIQLVTLFQKSSKKVGQLLSLINSNAISCFPGSILPVWSQLGHLDLPPRVQQAEHLRARADHSCSGQPETELRERVPRLQQATERRRREIPRQITAGAGSERPLPHHK